MIDKRERFERAVLRPLQRLLVVLAVLFLLKGLWLLMAGSVLAIFYVGIIGAKLHPMQSATDLAKGPLEGPAARVESESLPLAVKEALVGRACTSVGILLGLTTALILSVGLGWHWYFTLIAAWPTTLLSGGLLKLAFETI